MDQTHVPVVEGCDGVSTPLAAPGLVMSRIDARDRERSDFLGRGVEEHQRVSGNGIAGSVVIVVMRGHHHIGLLVDWGVANGSVESSMAIGVEDHSDPVGSFDKKGRMAEIR
jgi:hypothetical protein